MKERQVAEARMIVDGKPMLYNIISNPLIDDVVITEARLQAYEIENGTLEEGRRVDRGVRDFLIRLGVER